MNTYSIVIPHKNDINGLSRLLKSLYEADDSEEFYNFLKYLTIIIIDDYSNKEIFDKILELNKKYNFILLKNYRNPSAGACRNIGLSYVNSDYVFFSDSDDFFDKDYYKVFLKFDNNDSDIIFFSPSSVFNSNTNQMSDRHFFYSILIEDFEKNRNESKLRYMWLGPWSKRYKSSFLKKYNILFDETVASNDVMFSVVAGHMANKISASKDTIYILTRREGSLIYTYSEEILKARVSVGIKYKNYCDSIGFFKYKDHCINHLMRGMVLGLKPFLRLLKYAKKVGVFHDKYYFMKYLFRALAGNILVFFLYSSKKLIKVKAIK